MMIDMNARIAADRAFAKVSGYGPDFFDVPAATAWLTLAAAATLKRHVAPGEHDGRLSSVSFPICTSSSFAGPVRPST